MVLRLGLCFPTTERWSWWLLAFSSIAPWAPWPPSHTCRPHRPGRCIVQSGVVNYQPSDCSLYSLSGRAQHLFLSLHSPPWGVGPCLPCASFSHRWLGLFPFWWCGLGSSIGFWRTTLVMVSLVPGTSLSSQYSDLLLGSNVCLF